MPRERALARFSADRRLRRLETPGGFFQAVPGDVYSDTTETARRA